MLTWEVALERNVALTGCEGYRDKCAEAHPDHVAWRREMVRMAEGGAAEGYPSMAAQVGSALGAVGRAIGAGLVGLQVVRSGDEIAKCLAICHACEYFVAAEGRCAICGCYAALKVRLAQEHCPLSVPKW